MGSAFDSAASFGNAGEGLGVSIAGTEIHTSRMATNEFRWGVEPSIPGHWHYTLRHEGFDVEVASDWIELRKTEDAERDVQQRCAQQIVDGIIRKIGLAEKTRFTAKLGGIARFDPLSNRRDITVLLSDSLGLTMSSHADVLVTAADGTIVSDSRKDLMSELLRFANSSAMNDTLGRMCIRVRLRCVRLVRPLRLRRLAGVERHDQSSFQPPWKSTVGLPDRPAEHIVGELL